MTTTYSVASSLDGFVAAPGDDLDWLLQFGFEPFQEHHDHFFAGVGAIVMGSSTFAWLTTHEGTWPYPDLPTWVFTSRALTAPVGADVRFVSGPVTDHQAVIERSAGARGVWVMGGGLLAAQYQEAGLLDELRVTVMPLALGTGAPLLPVAAPTSVFELVGTTPFRGGAVELHYRAGDAVDAIDRNA
ncbi:dihydrofolate reductase [Curtobacterium sp. PhB130]|uniref:dihydrofolate reductase family protein n=1 Tax=unclassified Curtobacterium TaxID=257496 RepID=UPI000F4D1C12|nr:MULTISPECIES: dihydrofolate reductase family protein [unclassified Curtobacterium]ROS77892.1 dihydrofolate reductase [Curtobacterium sp. PhB130]TCK65895.1 dihydrofolate reductase [Curtobacterium sp. PhB136]